jgi:hypothetical protein
MNKATRQSFPIRFLMKCKICSDVRSAWRVSLIASIVMIVVAAGVVMALNPNRDAKQFQETYQQLDQRQFKAMRAQ